MGFKFDVFNIVDIADKEKAKEIHQNLEERGFICYYKPCWVIYIARRPKG